MLTSRHDPDSTLADRELRRFSSTPASSARSTDFHHDFALVNEEALLHLPRVLGALEAVRWYFHNAAAEEW